MSSHTDSPSPPDAPSGPASPKSTPFPWILALSITLLCALLVGFAFHPQNAGRRIALLPLGAGYALLSAVAIARLHKRGELQSALRPKRGDLTLGALLAALLYGIASAVTLVISSNFKLQTAWIMRLYLQLGDRSDEDTLWLGAGVFVIAALEEMTWRGLVMHSLKDVLAPKRAMLISSILFALAHTPTLVFLAVPGAGPNPLLVAAGLGCSIVWGSLVLRYQRLTPALYCHAFFSWAIVEFPIFRP